MNDFDNLLILNSLYTTASLVTKLDNYILHPSSCKHFVFWAQLTDDYVLFNMLYISMLRRLLRLWPVIVLSLARKGPVVYFFVKKYVEVYIS